MAQGNNELAKKLQGAGAPMVPSSFQQDARIWYANNRKQILALVGGSEDRAALYIACAFAQVNKIPQLMDCTPQSFYQALVMCMGTGLLPGPSQECCIIPFQNKGNYEATFIPMYQGLVKLAYNSGFVTRITGHVVYESDQFEYDPVEEKIYHRPAAEQEGKRVAVYSIIKNRYGEIQPMVKNAKFVDSIKARSRGAKSSYSPWNSQYPSDVDAMWLKTAFKQAAKWIPKATTPQGLQLAKAIEIDNAVDTGESITASLLSDDVGAIKEQILGVAAAALPPAAELEQGEKKHLSFFPAQDE